MNTPVNAHLCTLNLGLFFMFSFQQMEILMLQHAMLFQTICSFNFMSIFVFGNMTMPCPLKKWISQFGVEKLDRALDINPTQHLQEELEHQLGARPYHRTQLHCALVGSKTLQKTLNQNNGSCEWPQLCNQMFSNCSPLGIKFRCPNCFVCSVFYELTLNENGAFARSHPSTYCCHTCSVT